MSDKMGLMAFADYVERNIRDYLPEEYRGAAIQCAIVDKPGYYDAAADPMVALSVLKPGANIAPAVYLKQYHEKYRDDSCHYDKVHMCVRLPHLDDGPCADARREQHHPEHHCRCHLHLLYVVGSTCNKRGCLETADLSVRERHDIGKKA